MMKLIIYLVGTTFKLLFKLNLALRNKALAFYFSLKSQSTVYEFDQPWTNYIFISMTQEVNFDGTTESLSFILGSQGGCCQ